MERRAMTAARWVLGLLGTAAGGTLNATLPVLPVDARSTAGPGAAMLLLTAAALLAPVAIVPLVRALTWPRWTAATGTLVRAVTLTGVRRVASTAAPVLLAVGFTVLLTGTVATIGNVTGPPRRPRSRRPWSRHRSGVVGRRGPPRSRACRGCPPGCWSRAAG